MLTWWRLLPLEWQLGLVTSGVLVLLASYGGAYAYGDHEGAAHTDLKWQAKWDGRELEIAQQRADEHDRQDTINTNAKLREAEEIAERDRQYAALLALNEQLAVEAAGDPDKDRPALSAAAVQRYNRLVSAGGGK